MSLDDIKAEVVALLNGTERFYNHLPHQIECEMNLILSELFIFF